MMGKVKDGSEFKLVGAILQRGAHEGGGTAEIPSVRGEMLIIAVIAFEAGQRVIDLKIDILNAAERIRHLQPVFALQTVVHRAAHGIVHVQIADVRIDTWEGSALIGADPAVPGGRATAVIAVEHGARIEAEAGEVVDAGAPAADPVNARASRDRVINGGHAAGR